MNKATFVGLLGTKHWNLDSWLVTCRSAEEISNVCSSHVTCSLSTACVLLQTSGTVWPRWGGVLGCDPQYVCQRAGYVVLRWAIWPFPQLPRLPGHIQSNEFAIALRSIMNWNSKSGVRQTLQLSVSHFLYFAIFEFQWFWFSSEGSWCSDAVACSARTFLVSLMNWEPVSRKLNSHHLASDWP